MSFVFRFFSNIRTKRNVADIHLLRFLDHLRLPRQSWRQKNAYHNICQALQSVAVSRNYVTNGLNCTIFTLCIGPPVWTATAPLSSWSCHSRRFPLFLLCWPCCRGDVIYSQGSAQNATIEMMDGDVSFQGTSSWTSRWMRSRVPGGHVSDIIGHAPREIVVDH